MSDKKKRLGLGLTAGSLLAALYSMDPERFTGLFGAAAQTTIARDLFLFSMAALIHSWRVGIKFEGVTSAIINLGDKLRDDFAALGGRIERVEKNLTSTTARVDALEKPK